MTENDTLGIMAVIKAAYPSYYKGMTKLEAEKVLGLWHELFADDDPAIVGAAVKALIACDTKGYPPHIGAVKEYIGKIKQPDTMTEQDAWGLVYKAITRSGYDSSAEYKKLPPVLQRLVGSPSQLRDWSMMDGDMVNSVVASNFMRSYRARASYEREALALPDSVKSAIGQITERMTMPLLEKGE